MYLFVQIANTLIYFWILHR